MSKPNKPQNQLPKFWRPKITSTQCLDSKIVHWDLIGLFSSGKAEQDDLWDWIETGYTYRYMVVLHQIDGTNLTDEAVKAVDDQVAIFDSVVRRYKTTGRVGFSGPELCIARAAADVFDDLIGIDRNGITVMAAQMSRKLMGKIRDMDCLAMGTKQKAN